eukprot:snap_masked-scaffold_31-processed-gene-2.47-mRNA-1 protein AED:1.00 eAED:1.00 QI:0/-1/0/0/-1/1/1/0/332
MDEGLSFPYLNDENALRLKTLGKMSQENIEWLKSLEKSGLTSYQVQLLFTEIFLSLKELGKKKLKLPWTKKTITAEEKEKIIQFILQTFLSCFESKLEGTYTGFINNFDSISFESLIIKYPSTKEKVFKIYHLVNHDSKLKENFELENIIKDDDLFDEFLDWDEEYTERKQKHSQQFPSSTSNQTDIFLLSFKEAAKQIPRYNILKENEDAVLPQIDDKLSNIIQDSASLKQFSFQELLVFKQRLENFLLEKKKNDQYSLILNDVFKDYVALENTLKKLGSETKGKLVLSDHMEKLVKKLDKNSQSFINIFESNDRIYCLKEAVHLLSARTG